MDNNSDKKFYSKSELEEFRQLITQKLDESKIEYKRLAESLKEFSGNSADSYNFTEYGNESREKEQVEILMARQSKFIDKLEHALIRIANGSYGICRISGELIPKERLRIVPHATTTVSAKMKQSPSNTEEA
ncbi:MAG: TraR/DksA C4-type zinc finger protein [Bacteroidia bacterium]